MISRMRFSLAVTGGLALAIILLFLVKGRQDDLDAGGESIHRGDQPPREAHATDNSPQIVPRPLPAVPDNPPKYLLIKGRVICRETGNAIPQARIRARLHGAEECDLPLITASSRGHFEIQPTKEYFAVDLSVWADGYCLEKLRTYPKADRLTVYLERGVFVTAQVRDQNAFGVPKARVRVHSFTMEGPNVVLTVTETDEAGRFQFQARDGQHVIIEVTPVKGPEHVEMHRAIEHQEISITLPATIAVSGRVVSSSGPIPGAAVDAWIVDASGVSTSGFRNIGVRRLARTTTDSSGTFTLGSCPLRTFKSGIDHIAIFVTANEYSPAWIGLPRDPLASGRPTSPNYNLGMIELCPQVSIKGRVVTLRGEPVPNVDVVAYSKRHPLCRKPSGKHDPRVVRIFPIPVPIHPADRVAPVERLWRARTDASGSYVINNAPLDGHEMELKVYKRGLLGESLSFVPKSVPMSQAPDIIAELPKEAAIKGAVVDSSGNGVPGALVRAPHDETLTDRTGAFELRIGIAGMDKNFFGPPPLLRVQRAGYAVEEIELKKAIVRTPLTIRLQNEEKMTVMVVGDDGPLSNATVCLWHARWDYREWDKKGIPPTNDARLLAITSTNEEGVAILQGLHHETVHVSARFPGMTGPFIVVEPNVVVGPDLRLRIPHTAPKKVLAKLTVEVRAADQQGTGRALWAILTVAQREAYKAKLVAPGVLEFPKIYGGRYELVCGGEGFVTSPPQTVTFMTEQAKTMKVVLPRQ